MVLAHAAAQFQNGPVTVADTCDVDFPLGNDIIRCDRGVDPSDDYRGVVSCWPQQAERQFGGNARGRRRGHS